MPNSPTSSRPTPFPTPFPTAKPTPKPTDSSERNDGSYSNYEIPDSIADREDAGSSFFDDADENEIVDKFDTVDGVLESPSPVEPAPEPTPEPFTSAPVEPAPEPTPEPFTPAPVEPAPEPTPEPFTPTPVEPAPEPTPEPFTPTPVEPAPEPTPEPFTLAPVLLSPEPFTPAPVDITSVPVEVTPIDISSTNGTSQEDVDGGNGTIFDSIVEGIGNIFDNDENFTFDATSNETSNIYENSTFDVNSNETSGEVSGNDGMDEMRFACEALASNEVYVSDNSLDVGFTYEVIVHKNFSVDEVVQSMDVMLEQQVAEEMIDCRGFEQRGRLLQDDRVVNSGVLGVENIPDFTTDDVCTDKGTLPGAPDTACHVVYGSMKLYVRNSTNKDETEATVQTYIDNEMNLNRRQYSDAIDGLYGVSYEYAGAPPVIPVSLRSNERVSEETLSPTWIAAITMISVGAIAIVAAVMTVLRRKKQASAEHEVFHKFQDDGSADSTRDETAETRDFFVDINIQTEADALGNELGNEALYGEIPSASPGDIPSYMTNTQDF